MAWVGRIVAWLVILGVGGIIVISVLIPRVAGATPYVVLTGSMRPAMPPGTMVVVKPVTPDNVAIGDVVTYQLKSGQPDVVTHRVIGMGNYHGEVILRTKGDANNTADKDWVRQVQVKGVAWYAIPYLGHVTNAVTGEQRQLATGVVITFLLGYAGFMFYSARRDRATARRESATKGDEP